MVGPARVTAAAGGAVVLAAWGLGSTGALATQLPVVRALADLLAVFAVLLAWRFRCSRVAIAAVLVAAVSWLLRGSLASAATAIGQGRALLAVVLPLNLGLLAVVRDRSLGRPGPLVHLAIALVQVTVAPVLLARLPGTAAATSDTGAWSRLLAAPDTARLSFLIAALFLVLGLLVRRGVTEMSLLLVLGACALSLLAPPAGERSVLLLGAAQLVLLVGLVEHSYRLAFHDDLTGLPGRRAFNEALHTLSGRFVVAMVDIDHFKRFNDRFGHEAGDQVLRMVAAELAAVGGGGRAFRYGGEEFAVFFAGRGTGEAGELMDTVRATIGARRFAIRSPQRPRKKPRRPSTAATTRRVTVTVSVGVAGAGTQRSEPEEVLRAADRALYRAKEEGRNRVVRA